MILGRSSAAAITSSTEPTSTARWMLCLRSNSVATSPSFSLRTSRRISASSVASAARAALATELAEVRRDVRSEKLGEVATEFDRKHNIHRAVEVGSVDEVIAAADLRPKIIAALEKGLGIG